MATTAWRMNEDEGRMLNARLRQIKG